MASVNPTASDTRYRIVFLERDPDVREVLQQALSLPPACFPDIRIDEGSISTPMAPPPAIFRTGPRADWESVTKATAVIVTALHWPGEGGLDIQRTKFGLKRFGAGTRWQEFHSTKSGRFVARLGCEVAESKEDGFLATARIRVDIGRKAHGATASEVPEIVWPTSNAPSRYDDLLVLQFGDGARTSLGSGALAGNRITLDNRAAEPIEIRRPLEASRFLRHIRQVADSLRATLAGP